MVVQQPVTSVATLVAPAPSGSLAPVGEQPPADFMDTGEPDPPTNPAGNLQQGTAAVEATGTIIPYMDYTKDGLYNGLVYRSVITYKYHYWI